MEGHHEYFEEESSSGNGGWVTWFCDLEGHEFFVEVSRLSSLPPRLMKTTYATVSTSMGYETEYNTIRKICIKLIQPQ